MSEVSDNINESPAVGIIIGSASDMPFAERAGDVLRELGVSFEVGVASAHRVPEDAAAYARGAASRGIRVIIAMAGLSAALPGALAAQTTLPVIGVPIASGALNGLDALYSIVQMPPGVPVACVGVDAAKNAALLAARVTALADPALSKALSDWTDKNARGVRSSRREAAEKVGLPPVPEDAYRTRGGS